MKAQDDISKYSEEEIIEKCKQNPFFFLKNFCPIKHPSRGVIPFDLYDFQKDLIKDLFVDEKKFFAIVKSRQLGISTVMAGIAMWLMTFRNAVEIIIVSKKHTISKKLHKKILLMYDNLPDFLKQGKKHRTQTILELENESRVECIAHDSSAGTRSIAATWVIIDEAHFIDGAEELWGAIEPSVDHGEKVIALSSTNGSSGWFYDICLDADEEDSPWKKIKLPWYVHPDRQKDRSPDYEWRKKKDRILGKRKASQEYDAEFGVSTDTYYDPDFIQYQEDNFVKEPESKDGKMWYWEHPQPHTDYLISVDCAEGGNDNNVVEVFKISTLEQVAEFVSDMGYMDFGFIPVKIAREYNNGLLVIEQNSVGTAVTQRAVDLDYHNMYYRGANNDNITLGTNTVKVGWKTTQRTRPLIIEGFRGLFESEDGIKIRSTRLLNEIKNFIDKNDKPQARSGYTDDAVMATAILTYVYKTSQFNIEHYGDINDMIGLLATANGKVTKDYEDVKGKSYEDIIKEKEINKKKKFAETIAGGLDQQIAKEFNWL